MNQQLLRDVAEWWASAVGLIESLAQTAGAIAAEVRKPESPLRDAVDVEAWNQLHTHLSDCGVLNCRVFLDPGLPDPLRSLERK